MYLVKIYKNRSCINGEGIFAGEPISKGTIVFYYSSNDTYLSKNEFQSLSHEEKHKLYEYGVEDEAGNWIVTDGDANHSCNANILSIFIDGLYCDIAVKDIQINEEITIDYGLFYSSFPWRIECNCNSSFCRGVVGSGLQVDAQTKDLWHSRIAEAVSRIFDVNQPLFHRKDAKASVLTSAIRSKQNPKIFPYIKFSLISDQNDT